MSTIATTTVVSTTPRQSMIALCERITGLIEDMIETLPGTQLGYALEPAEALVVQGIADIARKAGQVKGSRLTWSHKGEWFVFRNTSLGMVVEVRAVRPAWAVAPPKPRLIPVYVPEHLVEAVRLHLGSLVNA